MITSAMIPALPVSITAGSKTKETSAYTPFRNVFYGASTTKPTLGQRGYPRPDPHRQGICRRVSLTINVPAGAQRVGDRLRRHQDRRHQGHQPDRDER